MDRIIQRLDRIEDKLDKSLEKTSDNSVEIARLDERIESQKLRNKVNHGVIYTMIVSIAAFFGIDISH